MDTLLDLLEERPGDDTTAAVYCGPREVTRSGLRAAARDLAAQLRAAGVQPGSAIAVMLPNGLEVVAAMFGCWYAGCVYVPINPRATPAELAAYLAATRPAMLIAPDERSDVSVPVVVARDLTWSVSSRAAADCSVHDADIALVQWTSGTTGMPKPVLLRHSGFLKLLEPVLKKLLGAGSANVAARKAPMPNLIPTSMALSAGIYNVLFAFRVGAAAIIMERFDPLEFARLVERFQLRSTVLPPPAMTMLCDTPEVTSLSPLRYVRSISAPLSPLSARRFRDKFAITVLNCYGQTEIGGEIVGWNAADAREHGEQKLGSVGRPHDGVSLRIVDPDGAEVDVDTPGELYVKTPATSAGYADGADLGDRLGPDGWFRTGDIARVDPEGFLWIEGRVSDMINRGGLKVFPAQVEEVLRLHPSVEDCAVVGAPDERLGEVPWAFIVPADPSGELDLDVLAAHVREHLVAFKVPTRFVAVSELPRNEAGKVLHRALLAKADT